MLWQIEKNQEFEVKRQVFMLNEYQLITILEDEFYKQTSSLQQLAQSLLLNNKNEYFTYWWNYMLVCESIIDSPFLYNNHYDMYLGHTRNCFSHLMSMIRDDSGNSWSNLKLLSSIGQSLYNAGTVACNLTEWQNAIDILSLYDAIAITLGANSDDLHNPFQHALALIALSDSYVGLLNFTQASEQMEEYISHIMGFEIKGKGYLSVRAAKKRLSELKQRKTK